MQDLSFMTIGDSGFFHTIRYSIDQISRFYPESRVYIYDWGLTDEQREQLASSRVTIVPCDGPIGHTPLRQYMPDARLTAAVRARFYVKRWFFPRRFAKQQRSLFIFAQKPSLILDCLRRCNSSMVFLDGDAFLTNRIDEVFDHNFDVGVTLRPQDEILLPARDGECRTINVGVMFFQGDLATFDAFVQRWDDEVTVTRDYCLEQTSLSNLLEGTRSDIYDGYGKTAVLDAGGTPVRIKVFPCDTYNYHRIEDGFDPRKNKVLHFKGRRHATEHFEALREKLDLDARLK